MLRTLVFLSGAVVLAIEIAAARLFAPHFGTSIVVWANLIGLVLLYVAIGNWLGGRMATRRQGAPWLYGLVGAAGLTAVLIPDLSAPLLALGSRGVARIEPGLIVGSFLAAALVLAAPTILLGTVLPLAIGAAADRADWSEKGRAGRAAGELVAISTGGSIVGVFTSALLTIPLMGTRLTFALFGGLLALSAAVGLWRLTRRGSLGLAVLTVAAVLWAVARGHSTAQLRREGAVYTAESAYHYVEVVVRGNTRYLRLDEGGAVQSIYTPGQILTGGVWDDFLVAPLLAPGRNAPGAGRALIIGLAGGTAARGLAGTWAPGAIHGVELDPGVIHAARLYFDLDEISALTVFVADGRTFLAGSADLYDLIVLDAYRGPYIPFHLTTREFFTSAREHLTPRGVLAVNVVYTGGEPGLADAVGETLARVFGSVLAIRRADAFNIVLVAARAPPAQGAFEARRAKLAPGSPLALAAEGAAGRWGPFEPAAGAPLLTDDRAPVEWLVDRMILVYGIGHRFRGLATD